MRLSRDVARPRAPRSDVPSRQPQARPRRHRARDPGPVAGAPDVRPATCPARRRRRAGASSTGRSRPTTRWASTMPGGGPTRTSSSGSMRCSATTSASRTASTARACGSRSTSSGTSGFTSKRDIEAYGIAEFVSLCKQRVLTYAARQTEQSIRLGMWMDWNDPHELRRLRDLLAEDPAQAGDDRGPDRPGHRYGRDARRTPRDARGRRQLLHLQQREQRPHLGLPRRMPPAWLAVQGPRHDAVVRAVRDRHLRDGDERGLRRIATTPASRSGCRSSTGRARRCWSGRRRRGR